MPCYQVITIRQEFKVENFDLLLEAIKVHKDLNIVTVNHDKQTLMFSNNFSSNFVVDAQRNTIKSSSYGVNEKTLAYTSNQLKQAYSLEAIQQAAKKNGWLVKRMGDNRIQVQRY